MGTNFDRFKSYGMESQGAAEVTRPIGAAAVKAKSLSSVNQRYVQPVQQMGVGAAIPAIVGAVGKALPWVQKALPIAGAVAGALGIGGALGLGDGGGGGFDIGAPGPGIFDIGVTGPGVFSSTIPGLKQGEVPVKRYGNAYTAFYITNLGRHCCQDKNGVWKFWRPAKHIVIPRNPRIGTLVRGHKRTTRLLRTMQKRAKIKI